MSPIQRSFPENGGQLATLVRLLLPPFPLTGDARRAVVETVAPSHDTGQAARSLDYPRHATGAATRLLDGLRCTLYALRAMLCLTYLELRWNGDSLPAYTRSGSGSFCDNRLRLAPRTVMQLTQALPCLKFAHSLPPAAARRNDRVAADLPRTAAAVAGQHGGVPHRQRQVELDH